LRIEVEVGCDLLQHPDVTEHRPAPGALLDMIAERDIPSAALVVTNRHLEWALAWGDSMSEPRRMADINQRELIKRGARLLLTTDGFAYGPRIKNHPSFRAGTLKDDVPDLPVQLGRGHLHWLEGALERGMAPMEVLRSATQYIAQAYHVADVVGTLEPGKAADLLILDADPLTDVSAYRQVRSIYQAGALVDRASLGTNLQLASDPAMF
jgi:hypothetical protein